MRIPGVQYRQVESMGRYNTSGAQNEANAALMLAKVEQENVDQVGDAVDAIYEAESKRQAARAINTYNETYTALEAQQMAPKNGYGQQEAIYDDMQAEALEAAEAEQLTGLARNMFRQESANQAVKYKAAWASKNKEWWMADGKAATMTRTADLLNQKDYGGARAEIAGNMFLTPGEEDKALRGIDAMQVYDGYSTKAKDVDVTSPFQARKTAALRAEIENDGSLSINVRNQLLAEVNQNVIDSYSDFNLNTASALVPQIGLKGAVKYYDDLMLKTAMTPYEELGGDLKMHQNLMTRYGQDRQYFVRADKAMSNKIDKAAVLYGMLRARTTADFNKEVPGDLASIFLFGGTINDNGKVEQGIVTPEMEANILSGEKLFPSINSGKGLVTGQESILELVTHNNFMAKNINEFLSAQARLGGVKGTKFVLDVLGALQSTPSGKVTLNSKEIDSDLKEVMFITDALGVHDPATVNKMFLESKSFSAQDKEAYARSRNKSDDYEAMNDAFEDAMENAFPDSTPELVYGKRSKVLNLAQELLLTHRWITPEQATQAAANLTAKEYTATEFGGEPRMKPWHQTVEYVFSQKSTLTPEQARGYVMESITKQATDAKIPLPKEFEYEIVNVPIGNNKYTKGVQPYVIDPDTGYRKIWPAFVPKYKGTVVEENATRLAIKKSRLEQEEQEANKQRIADAKAAAKAQEAAESAFVTGDMDDIYGGMFTTQDQEIVDNVEGSRFLSGITSIPGEILNSLDEWISKRNGNVKHQKEIEEQWNRMESP